MENENDKPNQQCEQTGGKSDKHQPTQHAQRIQKLAIIFPADDAGAYRPLSTLHPCESAIQPQTATDPTGASATARIAKSPIRYANHGNFLLGLAFI
jgi:hypothetical protein